MNTTWWSGVSRTSKDAGRQPLSRKLFFSWGLILGVTGLAKVCSAFGSSRILLQPDPIVGIKFRELMFCVGLLELGVAIACFMSKKTYLSALLTAWLSTSFLAYRAGLWWLDWHVSCPCLGTLTDALHVSPVLADSVIKVLLSYLLIGSWGWLIWQWRLRQKI